MSSLGLAGNGGACAILSGDTPNNSLADTPNAEGAVLVGSANALGIVGNGDKDLAKSSLGLETLVGLVTLVTLVTVGLFVGRLVGLFVVRFLVGRLVLVVLVTTVIGLSDRNPPDNELRTNAGGKLVTSVGELVPPNLDVFCLNDT